MRLVNYLYNNDEWSQNFDSSLDSKQTLIALFGSANLPFMTAVIDEVYKAYPNSIIIGASTAGEILQEELFESSIVVSVAKFDSVKLKFCSKEVNDSQTSFDDGLLLAKELLDTDLSAIFVLSDGLKVNGSKLTQGFNEVLPEDIVVTGGLAGDGDRFEKTWVIVNGKPVSSQITAVGLYGNALQVSHGSKGGWDTLGVDREVTKSSDNVLYEIDNKPALDLYKQYLGDKAQDLPASGLLFPLHLNDLSDNPDPKVRTILGVDEHTKSITFAGDIPEGSQVTLMTANFDRLIDGAFQAAEQLAVQRPVSGDMLCIAISCVGRKLVLKQRVEEELEATLEAIPQGAKQIGFYSYGEISPLGSGRCDLHNQTMTLTLLSEADA